MSKKIYICYQAEKEATVAEGYCTMILGIAGSEERAQEICNHDGDCYSSFILNENLGRIPEDLTDVTWNIEGEFIKQGEINNGN